MTAYYNEINEDAAAVLEAQIEDGVIAPGIIDTRSIKDVHPNDLKGFTQCHFFAGGGLWSVAARIAGWPDHKPLWTGSCPCQGESLAGKRLGADDPRHLWPDFHRLIRAERPTVVMGEQVAAAAGTHWLDRVCADLEDEDYASRAVDIPACAVDGPHQRQRLYWIAVANSFGIGQQIPTAGGYSAIQGSFGNADCLLVNAESQRWSEGRSKYELRSGRHTSPSLDPFIQSNASGGGRDGRTENSKRVSEERATAERSPDLLPNGSWWSGAEWIVSPIDGKARRTKPGLPFLVDGLPGRVGLWSVAGNAISPILAAEVIAAFIDEYGLPQS